MEREIKQRLVNDDSVEVGVKPTLEYYANGGLLSAKQFFTPVDLNFYSRIPDKDDGVKWTSGASEQSIAVPFEIPADDAAVRPGGGQAAVAAPRRVSDRRAPQQR